MMIWAPAEASITALRCHPSIIDSSCVCDGTNGGPS